MGRLRSAHSRYNADATILLQDVENPKQFGVVIGQEVEPGTLEIQEAVEKPDNPKSKTAIMPVYLFDKSVFHHISQLSAGKGGEIQLTDAIQSMIESGKKVMGIKLQARELRLDIGSPETLLDTLKLSEEYLNR
jgi:dTDP-glucose pyrophosphorylase